MQLYGKLHAHGNVIFKHSLNLGCCVLKFNNLLIKVNLAMNSKDIRDFYCWKCGKMDTKVKCTTCIRSFHEYCLEVGENEKDYSEKDDWVCPACIHLRNSTEGNR